MSTRSKTVLKTVRLPVELKVLLQSDAKSKRTTLNALMTTILMRYAEWDRFTEKFGVVTLSADLFRSLMEKIDEKELQSIAEDYGTRLPMEAMLFWFRRANLDTFLQYLSLNSRYGNLGEYELKVDGRDYTISIHHSYGENYSRFARIFLSDILQKSLGLAPRFQITKNEVVIDFQVP